MNGEVLIELDGIDVLSEGGTSPLLRGVNWRIVRGECWAIGGAPGAGKIVSAGDCGQPESSRHGHDAHVRARP